MKIFLACICTRILHILGGGKLVSEIFWGGEDAGSVFPTRINRKGRQEEEKGRQEEEKDR